MLMKLRLTILVESDYHIDHAIISFMISFAPAYMRWTRLSAHMRAIGYSII